jgi:hypothetical protein
MSRRSWDQVLDAFATRLAEQRAALHAGQADSVPPFAPPPSMGPFPSTLRARAETLLQEAAELQAEMAASLAATTREVQMVRRFVKATAVPVAAVYVDSSL